MIETIMYLGIGFLFAGLIGVAFMPLVHGRAVRLTIRRLEAALPQSMEEIRADKDLLRAEFAMSMRRLEMSVEQLKTKSTSQLAELGRKGDAINRLKVERDALKVEIVTLKTQVEATAYSTEMGTQASLVPAIPTIRQSMQEDTPPLQPLSRVVSQSVGRFLSFAATQSMRMAGWMSDENSDVKRELSSDFTTVISRRVIPRSDFGKRKDSKDRQPSPLYHHQPADRD
jgi:hypothetical protein